jgi:diguanylate cyclase (GGDEF)-like protein
MHALDRHLSGATPAFRCEHRLRSHAGAFRWVVAEGVADRDPSGRAVRLAGTLADVQERNHTDTLAGLPGLFALRAHVERLVAAARDVPSTRFALLLVDLDRFGAMNAMLGLEGGDVLLREALRRLARCLREGDLVARIGVHDMQAMAGDVALPPLGGDECALVISHLIDARDALRVAARLRDAYSALVRAKARGPAETQLFDDSARAAPSEFMEFAPDLETAMREGQFEMWFQPTVHLGDGSIVRAEALLRWRHPARGLLRPNIFVPLLEQAGRLVPFGWQTITNACRSLAQWRAVHPPARAMRISVNLSSSQLLAPDLVGRLLAAVRDAGVEPGDLELEIAELDAMANFDRAVQISQALRDAGFKVALDDFGLGLAATEHIRALGVQTLKIDRSYLGGNPQHGGSTAIVQYAIELAAVLGIEVVAEGIETPSELQALKKLRCPLGQGFYFARAVPADELRRLLELDATAGTDWWAGTAPASARRRRGSDAAVPAS